jgi:ubiquinone/menaquinone biosynthesis C-methylase UbiE
MSSITKSIVDIYDTISDSYAKQYTDDSSDKPHIDTFLAKLPPKSIILDAGCGVGQTVSYMTKKGFVVTGIDLSVKMLSIARKKYPGCLFQKMDMLHIDFPQESFDGILSSYSLIHIPENHVPGVLSNFYQMLKKGGRIAIFGQQGETDHYVDEPFAPGKKTFFNFFTSERITEKLTKAGFSSITIKSVHCDDPYNMSNTNLYIFAKK